MATVKVGIIGGSGLSDPEILQNGTIKSVDTPYGKPSDDLVIGEIEGVPCVLLSRHGKKHSIMPSNINYRANIEALRQEGCTHVIATTACGSLDDKFFPGDFALPDQFIDRTTKRCSTFYDGAPDSPQGVCHIPMASPFCQRTRQLIKDVSWDMHFDVPVHDYGTVVTIEGPRFSSQAESKLFQRWGGHVINMTTVPEVVLAKEAGLIYATIAMVTDYDSWRGSSEDHVNVEKVMKQMEENSRKVVRLLLAVIPKLAEQDWQEDIVKNKETARNSVMLF